MVFDTESKCCRIMLCLLVTLPQADIQASLHTDTSTCLSSPSSAPSPHLFLLRAYFCRLIWSHWQKCGSSTPPTPSLHPLSSVLLLSQPAVTVAVVFLPLQHPRRAHAVSTVCLCSLLIRAKYIDRGRERGMYQHRQAGRGTVAVTALSRTFLCKANWSSRHINKMQMIKLKGRISRISPSCSWTHQKMS